MVSIDTATAENVQLAYKTLEQNVLMNYSMIHVE